MANELYFISSNKQKVREAQQILGIPLKIIDIDLMEIQDSSIEAIVKLKAEDAFEKVRKPLLVDDVGLYVSAWNGFPGPFIKFLFKSGGKDLFMQLLGKEANYVT